MERSEHGVIAHDEVLKRKYTTFLYLTESDGLLVGAELLDIALDGLLEISKRVADLGYSCHLAGFAENDLDLIFLVFLCQVGIEVDLLETDGVAEVEG